MKRVLEVVLVALWMLLGATVVDAAQTVKQTDPFSTVLAEVELGKKKQTIVLADYLDAYQEAVRSKFYHGKAPENEVNKVKQETWQQLLDDTLIALDFDKHASDYKASDKVSSALNKYEQRYGNSPAWPEMKARVLPLVQKRLIRNEKVELKKAAIEQLTRVSEEEVKNFYLKNPRLFTEPERNEVSIILISVDPSSGSAVWEKVIEQMKEIRSQIKNIDDFRKMAELYSTDPTAEQGGNMGILHEGQLGGVAMETVKKLKVGEVSEPVVLLEGVALFTVTKRIGATHHTYEAVKKRANALALREKRKKAWQDYVTKLRNQAKIKETEKVNEIVSQA